MTIDTHLPVRTRRRSTPAALLSSGVALLLGAATLAACSPTSADVPEPSPLTERLQSLVDEGFPAALASVTEADGHRTDVAVGVGDLESGARPPVDGEVRIGSNTKMYVATIVLQLVDEGAV